MSPVCTKRRASMTLKPSTPNRSSYQACKRRSEQALPLDVLQSVLVGGVFASDQAIRIRPCENEQVDRAGVDVWVDCHNGKSLGIDLKIRQVDCRNFGQDDVALEIVSNIQSGTPGWAIKPGPKTDYIVPIWTDTWRALKLPAEGLQRAVNANLEQWWKLYPARLTSTRCSWLDAGVYHSVYIFVPRNVILDGIAAVTGTAGGRGVTA